MAKNLLFSQLLHDNLVSENSFFSLRICLAEKTVSPNYEIGLSLPCKTICLNSEDKSQ